MKRINLLLMAVMLLAALAAFLFYPWGSYSTAKTVALPVTAAWTDAMPPLEQYRLNRDQTELRDMAALETILQNDTIDAALRSDAAAALQALVDARQRQLAMEGALLECGFGPCTAVVTGDQLTIITPKVSLDAQDSALLAELALVHADVAADGLRVLCAGE